MKFTKYNNPNKASEKENERGNNMNFANEVKTVEYYEYGDCCCVVGTVNSFANYDDMVDYYTSNYGACDFVKVETPENATDDMLVW